MNDDVKRLKLLSAFHYILGAMMCVFSFFPLAHVIIGWLIIFHPEEMLEDKIPPEFVGWFFLVLGSIFILLGFILATVIVVSGQKMSKLKNYWFSFVVSCMECLLMPLGTILGIFTIITLSKESVKNLYGVKKL